MTAKTPEARSLQRHFEDLVTVVQDPSLLSTKLYSREILSSELLERASNPTLARQFKNIAVLSAVISYLEVHPEKFSEVIEVLKGDPTLAPLAARIVETYEILKALPQDGQPNPLPHPPSAISRYANYLKLQYKLPAVEKWPPSPLRKTIDQILIEKTDEEPEELTKASETGASTKVSKQKKAILVSEILNTDDGSTPKCVVVEGGPGSGKSTLAWGACQGWASGKLFTEYDLVVLLRLREEQLRDAKEVADLFSHDDPTLQNKVAREVLEREGKGVLFLLEALDEFPSPKLTKNSVFMKLLTGRTLPAATILITSRPWAIKHHLGQCVNVVSRHLELFGFTEENISQYVTEAFPDEQEYAGFQMYLDKQPYMKGMMNVPLNCCIVVQLYKSYMGTPYVPKTNTQLYSSLVLSLLQRYVMEYEGTNLHDLANLPSPICEQFHAVCKLAFTSFTKPSVEVIFADDDLPVNFTSLGLMQTATQVHPDVGTRVSYNFLHITVQEFLAAFYLSLQNEQMQIDFFLQNLFSTKFDVMFAFLLGLTDSSLTLWNSLVLAFSIDNANTLDLSERDGYLCWLYESQNIDACMSFLRADLIRYYPSYLKLLPLTFYVLGYCIFHSNSNWEISFSSSSSVPKAALMLSAALNECSHTTTDVVSFTGSISSLKSSLNCIGDEAFISLLNTPPRIMCGLSTLTLKNSSEITSVSCRALAHNLNKKKLPNLKSLELNGSSIHEGGAAELISALSLSSTIQRLELVDTGIGCKDAEELGKLLMTTRSLQVLNIAYNPLDSASLQLIASVLPENKSLQQLNLSAINLTDADVAFLALGVQENCSLKMLRLESCSIDRTGAIHLAEALKDNQTLKMLYMPYNSIGDEGAQVFAEMLESNRTLEELNLVENSIQIKGAVKLINALETNITLNRLCIDESSKPPELYSVCDTSVISRCKFA